MGKPLDIELACDESAVLTVRLVNRSSGELHLREVSLYSDVCVHGPSGKTVMPSVGGFLRQPPRPVLMLSPDASLTRTMSLRMFYRLTEPGPYRVSFTYDYRRGPKLPSGSVSPDELVVSGEVLLNGV